MKPLFLLLSIQAKKKQHNMAKVILNKHGDWGFKELFISLTYNVTYKSDALIL